MKKILVTMVCLLASAAVSAAAELPGRWMGVVHESAGRFHADSLMDIEIREVDGKLTLLDHDRQRGTGTPVEMTVNGTAFEAHYVGLWPTPVKMTGRLAADGETLEVELTGVGMTGQEQQHATLRHTDAAALRFESPGADEYKYRPPRSSKDGIPVSTARAEGMKPQLLEAMVESIRAETGARDARQTEGVLILRHGKLVFEEYFWGQTADNPHVISSCTKSLTSILAGIAADAGRLRTDSPVIAYFPEHRDSSWGDAITVRNILSMSSGTAWDDTVKGPKNPSWLLLQSRDVTAYVLSQPVIHPPGSVYNYDNGLPSLMGNLVARATGEPYERFAERVLFGPLGITNYRWTRMPDGNALAAGGFFMRPRDMVKIGLLMLNQGRWQGRQILSAKWVAESTQQQSASDQYPYGYYWHLTNAKHRHVNNVDGYMALGQGGQIIAVFPTLDLVVVTTSQNWFMPGLTAMPYALFNDFILPAIQE